SAIQFATPGVVAMRTVPMTAPPVFAAPGSGWEAEARAASTASAAGSRRRPRPVSSQPSGDAVRTRSPTAFSSAAIRRDTVVWLTPMLAAAAVYLPRRATASRARRSSGAIRRPAPAAGAGDASGVCIGAYYLHPCTPWVQNPRHSGLPWRASRGIGWEHLEAVGRSAGADGAAHSMQGGIMATIGWIGLGNMGRPMTRNLVAAGHTVTGFDVVADAVTAAAEDGITPAGSIAEAVAGADIVFTMLPKGEHARSVYLDEGGVLDSASTSTLLVDSSTIDFDSARELHKQASDRGLRFIDGPVSGGVGGAQAGTLTFMLGGADDAIADAKPVIEAMAGNIFHAGGEAAGQAAKIVNNMQLSISLQGVVE